MAADEPPIPVEHTLTATPFVFPVNTTYSRFSAIKRASSSSSAMRRARAGSPRQKHAAGDISRARSEYASGPQRLVSQSYVLLRFFNDGNPLLRLRLHCHHRAGFEALAGAVLHDAEFADFSLYQVSHLIAMKRMQDDLPSKTSRFRSRRQTGIVSAKRRSQPGRRPGAIRTWSANAARWDCRPNPPLTCRPAPIRLPH